jgi:signal transduction histidine kinase
MSQRHAQVLRLRTTRALEQGETPEAVADAALTELEAWVPFQRAGVVVWHPEGGREPTLLAVRPDATDEALARVHSLSGSLVNIPLEAGAHQFGLLSFVPQETDGLPEGAHRVAQRIAERLGAALARLEREEGARAAPDAQVVHERVAALEARIAELEQDNDRLRESNAELESFVHSVSHDLVSPVRTIRSATQGLVEMLLQTGHVPQEAALAQARHVDAVAAGLGGLVDELAAYNQLGRATERRIALDPYEVVDEAVAQLATEIECTGARVIVEQPLPDVLGHHGTLVQAVMNLLTNAMKFVAPGIVPEVRIHGSVDDTRARIGVTDNGIGMRTEHQERIFRPFERLHGSDAYPGSGLGLAIVQRGIARLDGQVTVQSAPGCGSTFWLELPRPEPTPVHHSLNALQRA